MPTKPKDHPDAVSEDASNSEDEENNRLGLSEERGLFTGHEEVVVPPEYETDEDRPIAGAEPPFEMNHTPIDGLETQPPEGIMGSSDEDDGDGFTVHNRQAVTHLENPELDLAIGEPVAYPPGPPPAYFSASDEERDKKTRTQTTPPSTAGLNNLLLGTVSSPFENMRKAAVNESSAEESEEENGASSAPRTNTEHMNGSLIQSKAPPVMEDMDDDDDGVIKHRLDTEQSNLVKYFTLFQNAPVEIDLQFLPFTVEMMPAVGDLDPFIKIPRPDEIEDNVGLVSLDEPATKQSDPVIVDMQMRTTVKDADKTGEQAAALPMKNLERADKNTKQIEDWIANIKELHRARPSTAVHYSRQLPDIEKLMQEWPAGVERSLKDIQLPSAELDVPLETYVDLVLNIVDIPVHKSRLESLHVLFSLYGEFKNSQHFRGMANKDIMAKPKTDRLEL